MPNSILRKLHKGSCYFLRQNPIYYNNELRLNTIRRREKRYDENRYEEIKYLHEKRRGTNKGLPPKLWDGKEIEYLREHFKKENYEKLAIKLGRSTDSIEHKVIRLGFRKNNRWQK